jgi:hypothetical protein
MKSICSKDQKYSLDSTTLTNEHVAIVCVLILLYMCICVLILLYMCIYVSSYYVYVYIFVSCYLYVYMCVLILLYMCPFKLAAPTSASQSSPSP